MNFINLLNLTHNEGKSVVAERFITTLKSNFYKYMTPISKHVYTKKLDNIENEYSNTCHRTTKMKPVDVKSGNCIEYSVNSNDKGPKFMLGTILMVKKLLEHFMKEGCKKKIKKNLR